MSKKILCRIDPEDMDRAWTGAINTTWRSFIKNYLTAHEVPESPLLFAGVDELSDFVYDNLTDPSDFDAQALIDRFGIQWDKAPERTTHLIGQWATLHHPEARKLSPGEFLIPRPTPTIENQRRQAIDALAGADAEVIAKVLEVLG